MHQTSFRGQVRVKRGEDENEACLVSYPDKVRSLSRSYIHQQMCQHVLFRAETHTSNTVRQTESME